MAGVAMLALVAPVFSGWTHLGPSTVLFPTSPQLVQESNDVATEAERNMMIARYYLGRGDYTSALNRLKVVVMRYPTSRHVEEALSRLTTTYLALGIASEAQTTAAVLVRKFPNGHWSAEARDALHAVGLETAEYNHAQVR